MLYITLPGEGGGNAVKALGKYKKYNNYVCRGGNHMTRATSTDATVTRVYCGRTNSCLMRDEKTDKNNRKFNSAPTGCCA